MITRARWLKSGFIKGGLGNGHSFSTLQAADSFFTNAKSYAGKKPPLVVYGFCVLKYFVLTFCWHNKVVASSLLVLEWSYKAEALLTDLLVSGQLYLPRSSQNCLVAIPIYFLSPVKKGRNIVECYMLRPFAHPVACWWEFIAQSLKQVKLLATCKRTQQLPTLMAVVRQQCCVRWHGALHSR